MSTSPAITPASRLLRPNDTVRSIARAERMAIIVDAEDYFRAAKQAMLGAKRRILLVGWDFDVRVRLEAGPDTLEGPDKVGEFITWLSKRRPDLEIKILKWDLGTIKSIARGETPLYVTRWLFTKKITLRLDGAHPPGAAHHMKLLIVDEDLAFCGGIDMTVGRWDTRRHLDDDPNRLSPFGKKLDPWHDASSCVSGEAARHLAAVARERWLNATGETLPELPPATPGWPESVTPDFTDIEVGIARTIAAHDDIKQVVEIERVTLAIIAAAEKHLYIESQYLASRKIANAIAARLREPDGPEIVLINPDSADGWIEAKVMDSARIRLMHLIHKADIHHRFRLFYPVTDKGEPIYVHAKVLMADDTILKLGSSNFNNRSMGFDSECDVVIDARGQANEPEIRESIARIRNDLIAEHLAATNEAVETKFAQTNSLIATIDALTTTARHLVPVPMRDLTADEEILAETDLVDPERRTPAKYQLSEIWNRIKHVTARRSPA